MTVTRERLGEVLAPWLDNHMFVASTLIGYTVVER